VPLDAVVHVIVTDVDLMTVTVTVDISDALVVKVLSVLYVISEELADEVNLIR